MVPKKWAAIKIERRRDGHPLILYGCSFQQIPIDRVHDKRRSLTYVSRRVPGLSPGIVIPRVLSLRALQERTQRLARRGQHQVLLEPGKMQEPAERSAKEARTDNLLRGCAHHSTRKYLHTIKEEREKEIQMRYTEEC